MFDATGLDQRQRLEHLDRRANEASMRRVAGAGHESLRGVIDGNVDEVLRFDDLAAADLDDAAPGCHPLTPTPGPWPLVHRSRQGPRRVRPAAPTRRHASA